MFRPKLEDQSDTALSRGSSSLYSINTEDIWVYDFDEEAAVIFHERVMYQFQQDPYKPILINISSYGGDATALFSMMDTMDAVRLVAPEGFSFVTHAIGKAMSAGAVLLAYGDFRFASPRASIMFHQIISGYSGSHPANERQFMEAKRVNELVLSLIKQRCADKISQEKLIQLLEHDFYITPDQALNLGLIDGVGYPKLIEKRGFEIAVINKELRDELPGTGDTEADGPEEESGRVPKSKKRTGKKVGGKSKPKRARS